MKDTIFCNNHAWNVAGKLIDFSTPKVMGIVNCTPDSFFSSSRASSLNDVLAKVKTMVEEGVDIVDVGGYSTKPGAEEVSEAEELNRVIPVIAMLHKELPSLIISVDTFRASVAEQAIGVGVHIVNDVSGGDADANMFSVIAAHKVPYIVMHMKGVPTNHLANNEYNHLTMEVIKKLSEKITTLKSMGVVDMAIDPGFGFSKTMSQNFELLNDLSLFQALECPILVGLSRKSMLCKSLNILPDNALNATTAANTIAMMNGASIIRVHDVKAAVEARQIVTFTQNTPEIRI